MNHSGHLTIFSDLIEDHEKIKRILKDLCKTDEQDKTRLDILQNLKSILEPHSRAEEKVFYDYLRKEGQDGKPELLANEGYVEHNVVENLISQMENADPTSVEWTAQTKVLKELLEHHIKEEEGEMFKAAKKLIPDELAHTMADKFDARKENMING